jgi:hypothetical protein
MADVYRNARYELRLAAMEARLLTLCEGLAFLMSALEALGQFVKAQNDALPGERHNEGSARIH